MAHIMIYAKAYTSNTAESFTVTSPDDDEESVFLAMMERLCLDSEWIITAQNWDDMDVHIRHVPSGNQYRLEFEYADCLAFSNYPEELEK